MKFWLVPLAIAMMISLTPGRSLGTRPDVDPTQCSDLLADLGKKPQTIDFVGCPIEPQNQYKSVTALYTLPGTRAKAAELFLRQKFKMGKLRFICCYWGNRTSYKDPVGYNYEISMVSGETVEKNWRKIPAFEVRVKKYVTDP
jgi:hypothetical protein